MKKQLLIFIAIVGTLIISSCKKDEPAPVANFTPDKTTASANSSVSFTNSSTNATSYSWSFGDGGSSTEMSPIHIFTTAGTYTVTLTATGKGGSNTKSVSITILLSAAGDWDFTMTFSTGPSFDGTMTIDQDDDNKLTGALEFTDSDGYHYCPFQSGSKIATKNVTLIWALSSMVITFTGKLNTAGDNMSGTFSYQGVSMGSWTADISSKKKSATTNSFKSGSISSELTKVIK